MRQLFIVKFLGRFAGRGRNRGWVHTCVYVAPVSLVLELYVPMSRSSIIIGRTNTCM